jgi:hypothetical protein
MAELTVRQDELVVTMGPRERRSLTWFGLRRSRSKLLDGLELRVPLATVTGACRGVGVLGTAGPDGCPQHRGGGADERALCSVGKPALDWHFPRDRGRGGEEGVVFHLWPGQPAGQGVRRLARPGAKARWFAGPGTEHVLDFRVGRSPCLARRCS